MATARKLPSGNWRVNQYIGKDENGKRIYKSFTAVTKKSAEYAAADFVENMQSRKNIEDITLGEAYDRYIESKKNVLSPSTYREYKRSSKCSLQDIMGIKLSNITQEIVQKSINAEAAAHSPKSVRNAHGLLSAVLSVYLPNIRLHTTMPQKQKPNLYVPSSGEVERLLASVSGKEIEKAIMLAAFGSLRRSEIAALDASDISGNVITISKAMVYDNDKNWVIKQPKTFAGYRSIEMPDFVIQRFSGCSGRLVNLTPSTITALFGRELRKLSIPHFRFHDLRHYQASILHAMGVPDKYIIQRGGWQTDSTLKNIYQHTMDEKRHEVEKNICDFFNMQHEMQHE